MPRANHYELYCGNIRCPSRSDVAKGGGLFKVHVDDMPDGEVWLCPKCRPVSS